MTKIIGQAASLVSVYPTTIIQCHCAETLKIVVIVGIGPMVRCLGCGRGYTVNKILPDGSVEFAIEAPPAKVSN